MIKLLNKLHPKPRFFIIYILIFLVQFLSVLFPIGFQLRFLGKWNPLWFTIDDKRKKPDGTLSEDYRIYLRDFKLHIKLIDITIKWQWLAVLSWHVFRNRCWNFVELFQVDNGNPTQGNQNIIITKMITDNLRKWDTTKIPQDGNWVVSAGLKYIGQPGDDPWQVNRGDIISSEHSIINEGEIEYITPSGWRGWRRSYCKIVKPFWLFGAKRWRTVFMGTNSERYSFKYKHQRLKPWGFWED